MLGAYQGVDRVTLTEMTVSANSGISPEAATRYHKGKSAYVGGLVGNVDGGSVYHSTVSNGVISGKGYENLCVGGAVGQSVEKAYLVDNTVDCDVTAANAYRLYAGGFVGEMANSSARYNLVEPKDEKQLKVTEDVGTSDPPAIYAGGFVGNILGTETDMIRDNRAKTDLDVQNRHGMTSIYAGGFAGQVGFDENQVNLTACAAEADISVVSEREISGQFVPTGAFANVGGFVGQLYTGTIESCYAQGSVLENICHTARSGGFAGSIHENQSGTSKISAVRNCYAVGETVAASGTNHSVGSFAGDIQGDVYAIYADVNLRTPDGSVLLPLVDNLHDTADVKCVYEPKAPEKPEKEEPAEEKPETISESLNEANLRIAGCIMTLGGIAGESTGTVQNCMTASGSMVSGVYGNNASGGYVGGLVGYLTGASAKVQDSLSLSQVILLDKNGGNPKSVGAVVGTGGTKVTNTYFDNRLSRAGGLGTKCDTAALLDVPVINTGFTAQAGQYPILTWMAQSGNTTIRNLGKLSNAAFLFGDGENINSIANPFDVTCSEDIRLRSYEKSTVAKTRVTLSGKEGSIRLSIGDLSRLVRISNPDYEEKSSGGGGGGGGGGAPVEEEPSGILIEVDGTNYDIGTAESDAMSATVKVDSEKLTEYIREASEGSAIVVPLSSEKSVSKAVMTVGNIEEAAAKQLDLEVVCGDIQIIIPTASIDTADVMESFAGQKAEDVPFTVTVKTLSEPEKAELSRQTGHELLGDVVSFQITAGTGNAVHTIDQFSGWTERVLPVAENEKITTGVEIIGGKAIHKPTNVRTIHSLTNSVYAYIYNDVSFADAEGMWYADTVNEMASRLIVNGRDAATFDGDGTITRAEFAAILVRALGLHEDGDGTVFADVKTADWYCGAIGKAYELGLIKGRDSEHFAPNANITREEAMVLMERAAKLTGLVGSSTVIDRFDDASEVSDWALSAAQFNVGSGLIQGYDNRIHPRDSITRAESATVILRLLRMSDLIDVR